MKVFLVFMSISLFALSSSTSAVKQVEGVVIDKNSSSPVNRAYVYSVRGEEEGLTGTDGKFKFIISAETPTVLTIQHPAYKRVEVKIKSLKENKIYLSPL